MNNLQSMVWAVAALPLSAAAATPAQRPNIMLIMVDQLIADGMSCMENPYVSTPALDKIAANGVTFTNSYVTQPLSSPCRTSLHTGIFPHENGVITNGLPLKCEPQFLATQISESGYATAHFGKWHVPCELSEAGYDEGTTTLKDAANCTLAMNYLESYELEKPYFLTVSFNNPHNVCELARGEPLPNGEIGTPPEDMNQLPPLPANFEIPDLEPTRIREVQRKAPGQYPTATWGEREWREYLWGYYRLVEKVDKQIGMVLESAISTTKRELVVLFVSDHGEGVARHHWNQKQILYDQSVKVPTLIASFSGGGVKARGECDVLVSMSIDIPATIADIASAEQGEGWRGRSLWPLATKELSTLNRKYIFAETVFGVQKRESGLRGRMVRSDRYKYCLYDNGGYREQLFDMKKDSGETINLAEDSRYAKVLNQMREALKVWCVECDDSFYSDNAVSKIE